MNFESELKIRAAEIENKLHELYIPAGICKQLDESIAYTLFSGGKRLRPVLTLSTYRMLGGAECDSIYLLACAIEILHNYTLIHDDLPMLDNDDLRRGKPTNHKVFGEAVALLAGDSLLSLSHEYLYESIAQARDKSLYLSAAKLISELTGAQGTIGGQALEIVSDALDLKNLLLEIINGKTCKLIAASVLSGAIVAGADEKTLQILAEYAQCLGYAFQLSDDLMDEKEKGAIDKKSMVGLYGKDYTVKILEFYINKAVNTLDVLNYDTEFLAETVKYCSKREI